MADDVRGVADPVAVEARGALGARDLRRALLPYATEFLCFLDAEGNIVVATGKGLESLGYAPTDRAGDFIGQVVHPDDHAVVADVIRRAQVDPEFREVVRVRAQTKAGDWLLIEAYIQTMEQHPVLGPGAVLRLREIGDVDQDSVAVPADERFSSLAASLPTGVLTLDGEGHVVDVNDAACRLTGRSRRDLQQNGWIDGVHPDDLADIDDALHVARGGAEHSRAVFRIGSPDTRISRWIDARFVALPGLSPAGAPAVLVSIDDVTDRRREDAELARRATHDPLTGLPNRALLEDRLRHACVRLGTDDAAVTVLFGDLDRFKPVNDELGHAVGDVVLREIAGRLTSVIRASDTAARWGGDEFVIVCEDLDAEASATLVDRVRDAIGQPMVVGGATVELGVSIGMVRADREGTDAADLLHRADAAMYSTKRR